MPLPHAFPTDVMAEVCMSLDPLNAVWTSLNLSMGQPHLEEGRRRCVCLCVCMNGCVDVVCAYFVYVVCGMLHFLPVYRFCVR